jgi:2-iminobutanoate/2-iminopropanoate deaminase
MKIIQTPDAPQAIGPYSQAIITNNLIFCSGQIGINPATGQLEEGIEKQTQQVLDNIDALLNAAEITRDSVIKTTIFLADISTFNDVNKIYANFFQNHKPARSTVEVSNLPKEALIEIEIIAKTA